MNELSLSALQVGQSARVVALHTGSAMRRRLMDIGLIPGTYVTCVAKSPAGDPAAYRIRGAVIALRACDADTVHTQAEPLLHPAQRAVPA